MVAVRPGCEGWPLVQAICDYVNDRITFGYEHANPTKSAWDAYTERRGVCRDFAHLAVALCRCMNVPARYCTGYLGDIGVPPDPSPMDFSAWFEVYLGGRWYTFDARHNTPRIGRILMARGRDATDVAIVTSFGPCTMVGFKVMTDEVAPDAPATHTKADRRGAAIGPATVLPFLMPARRDGQPERGGNRYDGAGGPRQPGGERKQPGPDRGPGGVAQIGRHRNAA